MGPFQQLDLLDVEKSEPLCPRSTVVDAIDVHRGRLLKTEVLTGTDATHGDGIGHTAARHADAWRFEILEVLHTHVLQRLARDRLDGDRNVLESLHALLRRDHDFLERDLGIRTRTALGGCQ